MDWMRLCLLPCLAKYLHCPLFNCLTRHSRPNHGWYPITRPSSYKQHERKLIQINCSWIVRSWIFGSASSLSIAVGGVRSTIPTVPTLEACGCSRPWLPIEIGTHRTLTAKTLQERPVFLYNDIYIYDTCI